MILTPATYHSPDANRYYLSHSQYSDFLSCEAMALAKLSGDYRPERTRACLQGQMFHAWAAGELTAFLDSTPAVYKQKGGLYAEYGEVMTMIAALERDPCAMELLGGQKRVIITAELYGVPWKACLDVYRPAQRQIIDVKTARVIDVAFFEIYGYLRQAAIYAELERIAAGREAGDWCDSYLLMVTKESPPDKGLISLVDKERFAAELSLIAATMPRIVALKQGRTAPVRCETCPHCRATKVLGEAIHYTAL